MKHVNPILESLTGTAAMTDQIIASDLLIAAKSAVRNYTLALTESASPDVRKVLRRHLEDAIVLHEQVTTYLVNHGWYEPRQFTRQMQMDIENAETALGLPRTN